MKKIAVIGAGNIGSAIAASLMGHGDRVVCSDAFQSSLDRINTQLPDIETTLSNVEAVTDADMIVLAVKPFVVDGLIEEILDHIKPDTLIISVVATLPIKDLREKLNAEEKDLQVIKVVPNIAIMYNKSVTFLCAGPRVPQEKLEEVEEIFNRSGKAFVVNEYDLPACTALASCGIAYFLRFIHAAAEGCVEFGLKPSFATTVAAHTAIGAAALLSTGSHPETEIDKVTTPGGITIKGLNALEENGFTKAVISAIRASCLQ